MEDKTICITGHRPNKLPWGLNEEDSKCIAGRRPFGNSADRGWSTQTYGCETGRRTGADGRWTG